MLAVVMGGHDWFQASASAVGIPGVAGSDAGCDTTIRREMEMDKSVITTEALAAPQGLPPAHQQLNADPLPPHEWHSREFLSIQGI